MPRYWEQNSVKPIIEPLIKEYFKSINTPTIFFNNKEYSTDLGNYISTNEKYKTLLITAEEDKGNKVSKEGKVSLTKIKSNRALFFEALAGFIGDKTNDNYRNLTGEMKVVPDTSGAISERALRRQKRLAKKKVEPAAAPAVKVEPTEEVEVGPRGTILAPQEAFSKEQSEEQIVQTDVIKVSGFLEEDEIALTASTLSYKHPGAADVKKEEPDAPRGGRQMRTPDTFQNKPTMNGYKTLSSDKHYTIFEKTNPSIKGDDIIIAYRGTASYSDIFGPDRTLARGGIWTRVYKLFGLQEKSDTVAREMFERNEDIKGRLDKSKKEIGQYIEEFSKTHNGKKPTVLYTGHSLGSAIGASAYEQRNKDIATYRYVGISQPYTWVGTDHNWVDGDKKRVYSFPGDVVSMGLMRNNGTYHNAKTFMIVNKDATTATLMERHVLKEINDNQQRLNREGLTGRKLNNTQVQQALSGENIGNTTSPSSDLPPPSNPPSPPLIAPSNVTITDVPTFRAIYDEIVRLMVRQANEDSGQTMSDAEKQKFQVDFNKKAISKKAFDHFMKLIETSKVDYRDQDGNLTPESIDAVFAQSSENHLISDEVVRIVREMNTFVQRRIQSPADGGFKGRGLAEPGNRTAPPFEPDEEGGDVFTESKTEEATEEGLPSVGLEGTASTPPDMPRDGMQDMTFEESQFYKSQLEEFRSQPALGVSPFQPIYKDLVHETIQEAVNKYHTDGKAFLPMWEIWLKKQGMETFLSKMPEKSDINEQMSIMMTVYGSELPVTPSDPRKIKDGQEKRLLHSQLAFLCENHAKRHEDKNVAKHVKELGQQLPRVTPTTEVHETIKTKDVKELTDEDLLLMLHSGKVKVKLNPDATVGDTLTAIKKTLVKDAKTVDVVQDSKDVKHTDSSGASSRTYSQNNAQEFVYRDEEKPRRSLLLEDDVDRYSAYSFKHPSDAANSRFQYEEILTFKVR